MTQPAPTTSLPLISPITVMPGPSPTQIGVQELNHQGQKIVALQFATKHGVFFYFLSPESAKELGKALDQASGAGILIVPAGGIPG